MSGRRGEMKMDIDKKLIDLARRDLIKMATVTGTVGILASLGEAISPTLASYLSMQRATQRGGQAKGSPTNANANANDIEILNFALQLEQKAINTYLAAVEKKLLKGKDYIEVAKQFVADHDSHREALAKVIKNDLGGEPASVADVGTFPVPTIKNDKEAVRYAVTLELIAAKTYYDAFKDKLKTSAGKDIFLNILPVETQHIGVFRSFLKLRLKDRALPDNNRIVPFAFLHMQPTPEVPQEAPPANTEKTAEKAG
ncbi:MAG: ferritin-like domain-containing protein [Blastocatellia bacterium]|nr:ferritin-like domain-containing protein [Blastocatellia bacterium]